MSATPAPRSTRIASVPQRVVAGVLAMVCLAPLVLATVLSASPDGHGTHEQLGLPRCAWPAAFDAPCPTCGMTTAFAHTLDGDYTRAFLVQPAGMLIAVVTAALFWLSLHVAATGSRLGRIGAGLLRPRALWAVGAVLAASWVYKLLTW